MGTQWIINLQSEWKSMDADKEKEKWSRRSIYRVPKYIKDLNSNAYAPQVISFGPYYHNCGEHLKLMEPTKRRVLKYYLDQVGKTLETVVSVMRMEVRELMDAYDGLEEPWSTDEDRFLDLMILDGCCLLQVLLYLKYVSDDMEEQAGLCGAEVLAAADVVLLENQLPLRVLQILLDIGGEKIGVADATHLIKGFLPARYTLGDIPENGCHILDVFRTTVLGDGDFIYDGQGDEKVATLAKLVDSGVRLKESNVGCLRSIAFKKRVLELPYIPLDILTEPLLLNFVAFEYMHGLHSDVISFLTFMDRLIDSGGDEKLQQRNMALLARRKIVRGWTESDAELAAFFRRLVKDHQILRRGRHPKSEGVRVDKELIQYCGKKWPRFRANCNRASRGVLVKSLLASLILLVLHILFPSVQIEKL